MKVGGAKLSLGPGLGVLNKGIHPILLGARQLVPLL
jgi:hypothetical protein